MISDPSSFHTDTRISQKHNIDHNNSYYVVSSFAKNVSWDKMDVDIEVTPEARVVHH